MKIFKKNKGAAMVSVLIAITFIGILSTSLLFMAYMNYLTKATRHKSTDNFYTAEFGLDELAASLQEIGAKAPDIATAKTDMAAAIDPDNDGQWSNNIPHIVSTLMPNASKDASISLNCTVSSGAAQYSTSGQFEMNGVEVVATGKPNTSRDGYVSTIGTNLSVNFPSASGGPLDIYDFSLICDAPYKSDGGDTVFSGCVYLQGVSGNATYTHEDALVVADGMVAFLGKRNIINGDITVKKGGILNVVGDFQVNGKITVENQGAVIGTGNIQTKDGIVGNSGTYYVQNGINQSPVSLSWNKLPDNSVPGGTPSTTVFHPEKWGVYVFETSDGNIHQYSYEKNGGVASFEVWMLGNPWYESLCNITEVPGEMIPNGSPLFLTKIPGALPGSNQIIGLQWKISDAYTEVGTDGAQGLTKKLFAKTVPLRLQDGSGWVSLDGMHSDATIYNNMVKFSGTPGGYIVNGTNGTTYDSTKFETKFSTPGHTVKAQNLLLLNKTTKPMTLKGTFFDSTMLSEVTVTSDDRSLPVYLQKMDKAIYNKILDSYYIKFNSDGSASNWSSADYRELDGSGVLGGSIAVNQDAKKPLFPSDPFDTSAAATTLTYKDPNSETGSVPALERTAGATSSNVNLLPMRAFLVDDTARAIGDVFDCLSSDADNKDPKVAYEDWYKL